MARTRTEAKLNEQYLQDQADLYDRAQGIADQRYEAAPGARVAAFNQDQLDIMGAARQGFRTSQGYDPRAALQRSYEATPQTAQNRSFLTGNIEGYMNPYIDQVVDRTFRAVDRDTQRRQQAIRDDAISKKAFGNNRRFVQAGVAEAEGEFKKQQLASQLYSRGFDKATALQAQDMNRNAQIDAANMNYLNNFNTVLGRNAILGLQDQAQARDAFAAAGDAQQQLAQRTLDEQAAEFYRAQGYDEKQARFLADILYGQKVETTQTATAKDVGPSKASSAISGGLLGYAVTGGIGGAVFGALGGLF